MPSLVCHLWWSSVCSPVSCDILQSEQLCDFHRHVKRSIWAVWIFICWDSFPHSVSPALWKLSGWLRTHSWRSYFLFFFQKWHVRATRRAALNAPTTAPTFSQKSIILHDLLLFAGRDTPLVQSRGSVHTYTVSWKEKHGNTYTLNCISTTPYLSGCFPKFTSNVSRSLLRNLWFRMLFFEMIDINGTYQELNWYKWNLSRTSRIWSLRDWIWIHDASVLIWEASLVQLNAGEIHTI